MVLFLCAWSQSRKSLFDLFMVSGLEFIAFQRTASLTMSHKVADTHIHRAMHNQNPSGLVNDAAKNHAQARFIDLVYYAASCIRYLDRRPMLASASSSLESVIMIIPGIVTLSNLFIRDMDRIWSDQNVCRATLICYISIRVRFRMV